MLISKLSQHCCQPTIKPGNPCHWLILPPMEIQKMLTYAADPILPPMLYKWVCENMGFRSLYFEFCVWFLRKYNVLSYVFDCVWVLKIWVWLLYLVSTQKKIVFNVYLFCKFLGHGLYFVNLSDRFIRLMQEKKRKNIYF